jgi:NTP pyrophosphatase (non-canonical NTP hydrolase)
MRKNLLDEVLVFRDARDWKQFHTPENLAKAINIEAGELLECFQWSTDEFDKQEAREELADVIIYCLLMVDALDADLEKIVIDKMNKNNRKYPVEKAKGTSKKANKL